jgi:hypothetical protein
VLEHGVDVLERRVDLAAEQVGDRRAAALVRDVQAGRAALEPEQLAVRWSLEPLPDEAKLILPGFAFSYATTSASDLCGDAAGTTSTFGACTATVIGSKSASASYCMPLIRCGAITAARAR